MTWNYKFRCWECDGRMVGERCENDLVILQCIRCGWRWWMVRKRAASNSHGMYDMRKSSFIERKPTTKNLRPVHP